MSHGSVIPSSDSDELNEVDCAAPGQKERKKKSSLLGVSLSVSEAKHLGVYTRMIE